MSCDEWRQNTLPFTNFSLIEKLRLNYMSYTYTFKGIFSLLPVHFYICQSTLCYYEGLENL